MVCQRLAVCSSAGQKPLEGIDKGSSVTIGKYLGWPLGCDDGQEKGCPDKEGDFLGCLINQSETKEIIDGCPLGAIDLKGFNKG